MNYIFSKSVIGYSHLKSDKPCQDFSSTYRDPFREIITCCDGHGGEIYIRSQVGSMISSTAVLNVFSKFTYYDFIRKDVHELENTIKLNILCEWNRMVEEQLSIRHIKKSELASLNENQIYSLKDNPMKAYGSTLSGAMVIGSKLVVVGIGDSEVIGIKKGEMYRLLEQEDEPVGNVTYSMCQEDAYNYLNVRILDWKDYDGVILCTDGLSNPYQSYDNFNQSFIKPLVKEILESKSLSYIDSFIDSLALKLGVGDDVSLSFILKENISRRYYQ